MYVRKKKKGNYTYLYFAEDYYDPVTRKRSQRNIKSLGRLEDLISVYEDPFAHFKEEANRLNQEINEQKSLSVEINMEERLEAGEKNIRNVGYFAFRNLYKQLNIEKFWNWKTRNHSIQYSVEDIFRLLCISRIMYPGSKKETYEGRNRFFEPCEGFTLDDVYHCLDIIAENAEELQKWIYKNSESICKRDLSVNYFDCTNYYFDISRPDVDEYDDEGKNLSHSYRKRGPEKNHRPDPIIEMGLLMDKNGIPLSYNLFPGNESEKVNMLPLVNKVRNEYGGGNRVIVVADRGLNTSDNIYYLNGDNRRENNQRDGYVYGQSVRDADAAFKEWVLDGNYTNTVLSPEESSSSDIINIDKKIIFRHKSRIEAKQIHVNYTDKDGKQHKKAVLIDQKQMVYYSEKYAKKQKADRDAMIARAVDLIAHPRKYNRVTSAGSAAYVKNIKFNKETGEIVDSVLYLDQEKITEEEKYDGYYSIVTSELNMSDIEMRNTYRGLAKIEDTFKLSKSELEARPVFVWTDKHIEAHFATCFVALTLIRLLENTLGHKYPASQILESLKNYNCVNIDSNINQFIYYDDILKDCSAVFGVKLDNKYRKTQDIRRLIHY